jgi:hypothetical protein
MTNRMLFNIPDPMNSIQQFNRFYQLDIPYLKDEDLQAELWCLRSLLFRLPPEKSWIKERARELAKEYARRHYRTTQQPQISTNKIVKGVEL